MIMTAFIMALLILAAFMILFYKLPPWLRKFLSKRYILLDILLCAMVFWTLGFALIGLMSAGFISVFVSAYLLWYKKKVPYTPRTTRTRKSHVYWLARVYNWWKRRRAHV
jgi:hypothetical protein